MTNWHFGADDVVEALVGATYERQTFSAQREYRYPTFTRLVAYRLEGERVVEVARHSWVRVQQGLEGIEGQELSRSQWEAAATREIFEGTFVWLDEWNEAYSTSAWGPDGAEALSESAEDLEDVEERRSHLEPYVPAELVPVVMAELPAPRAAQHAAPAALASGPSVEGHPERVAESDKANAPPQGKLKRNALIAKFEREWPSIANDLNEASRSELKQAMSDKRGYWYPDKAREWAVTNGKVAASQGLDARANSPWAVAAGTKKG